jgi:hypothetical protein
MNGSQEPGLWHNDLNKEYRNIMYIVGTQHNLLSDINARLAQRID